MNSKKVNMVKKFDLPKKSAFTIETEKDFIKLHTLMVVAGKRGSGKSLALSNFLKVCKEKHYFDLILLVSPTYNSNKEIWDICEIKEEDVYEPTIGVVKKLIELVENEKQDWDTFLEEKKLYNKFQKEIKDKPIELIDDENLLAYFEKGYLDKKEPPKWKYPIQQPPRIGIILDDCINTEVMARRSSGLTNLALKHRHLASGLGCSLFFLVQTYISHDNISKAVRENCTHLLLFKISNNEQLKKIKSECDLPVSDEEFDEITKKVFEIPHNFLLIDFAFRCPTFRFRNGFNELIIPNSIKHKCTCKNNK